AAAWLGIAPIAIGTPDCDAPRAGSPWTGAGGVEPEGEISWVVVTGGGGSGAAFDDDELRRTRADSVMAFSASLPAAPASGRISDSRGRLPDALDGRVPHSARG